MSYRKFFLSTLTWALLLLLWLAPSQSQTKIRVGYGQFTNELVLLAMDIGSLKKPGIQVEFVGFPTLGRVPELMAAGKIDVGVFAVPAFLNAVDKGVNVVAVANVMGMSDPPVPYVTMADSGINKIEDLRGRTIAVSTFGGNFDLYLRYMLEKHGLDPKKDVTIVEMPLPQILAAVTAKRVDAGVLTAIYYTVAKEKYGDKIRVLFNFKDLDVLQGISWVSLVLGVNKDFLAKNREAVNKLLEGYLETVKFYKDQFPEALKIINKYLKSPELMKSRPFDISYDAKVDVRSIDVDIKIMRQFDYIKRPLSGREIVDNSLLDEILAAKK